MHIWRNKWLEVRVTPGQIPTIQMKSISTMTMEMECVHPFNNRRTSWLASHLLRVFLQICSGRRTIIGRGLNTFHRVMARMTLLSKKMKDVHKVSINRCRECEDRDPVISHLTLIFRMMLRKTMIILDQSNQVPCVYNNSRGLGASILEEWFSHYGLQLSGPLR